MIVAIDIGNSTIHIGIFEAGQSIEPIADWRVRPADLPINFNAWIEPFSKQVTSVLIASVSPPNLETYLATHLDQLPAPIFIPDSCPVPINNLTHAPETVGVDRLLNAYAAYLKLGKACIVVDFGTALTLDIINEHGDYEGGIIAPGLRTSIKALGDTAAQLFEVELIAQEHVIGKTTEEAIRSGYFHGYQGMITHLIEQIDRSSGRTHEILFTGGDAALIADALGYTDNIEPYLTLLGICHLAYHSLNLNT